MRFAALAFLSIGVFLLLQIILPVISFQLWVIGQEYNNRGLVRPNQSTGQVLGVSVKDKNNFPAFISNLTREERPGYNQFLITIPGLKIDQKAVFVDSNDLSRGLVQLPGSAMPGEKGNLFISGHSAFSKFIPGQNAIFAKLTDLKKDNEILVEAAGNRFVYKVIGLKIVDPSDLSVIAPPDSQGRYISLMTCVPPGLNFKRLVVLGKII